MYEATLTFVKAKMADNRGQWNLHQFVTHNNKTAKLILTFGHGYFTGAMLALEEFDGERILIDRPVEDAVRRFVDLDYPKPGEPWLLPRSGEQK